MEELNIKFFSNYGSNIDLIKKVEDNLKKIREEGYFKGKNNVDIYYQKYCIDNEQGKIVISHGFTECIEKYKELICYFMQMGYSVYCIEHRGHGRSGNLSKTHKHQINIEKFEYYIEDLKTFIDEVVISKDKDDDLYLFAHSMGGAIGTLFLEKYNTYFKKAILSAPMMEINTGKFSNRISYLISKIYIMLGKGNEFLFGHGPFDDRYNLESAGTSNKYRYENHLNELKSEEILQRSGGSFKWAYEAIKATQLLLNKDNIKNIKIPILLFQAGKDTFVKPQGHEKFLIECKDCKKVKFENGKHELYIEEDEILLEYLKYIDSFLK